MCLPAGDHRKAESGRTKHFSRGHTAVRFPAPASHAPLPAGASLAIRVSMAHNPWLVQLQDVSGAGVQLFAIICRSLAA